MMNYRLIHFSGLTCFAVTAARKASFEFQLFCYLYSLHSDVDRSIGTCRFDLTKICCSLCSVCSVAGLLLALEGLVLAGRGPPQHPYVEFIAGNTNLVISAPHDGTVEPPNIPVRRPGCRRERGAECEFRREEECQSDLQCRIITGRDTASAEIARLVFTKYLQLTGLTPHLVLSHLHRSRLDPNRALPEAAQDSQEAARAYQAFHGSIEAAHESLGARPGLHLDMHGYRDILKQNNTMIGYLYRKQELNNQDFTRSTPSIQALLNRTGIPAEEFVFGEGSLGSMFEKSGYRAVPSPRLALTTIQCEFSF